MINQTKYKIIRAKSDLLEISGPRKLVARLEAFGPTDYIELEAEMQKTYLHPETGEEMTFRQATTAESILINGYDFKNQAKQKILDRAEVLQLGYIAKTSEGVFINPQFQRDEKGNPIIDEKALKSFLKAYKKTLGIYLLNDNNHFAFVPYDLLSQDIFQDSEDFAGSGLARGLEYVAGREAPILKQMSENYPFGVRVYGFDPVEEPVLNMSSLYSEWIPPSDIYKSPDKLMVAGNSQWNCYRGCVSGVLV